MRIIDVRDVEETVRKLAMDANYFVDPVVKDAFVKALEREESELGKEIIKQMLENAELAAREKLPAAAD